MYLIFNMSILQTYLLLGFIFLWCEGYKVLVVIPLVAKSHANLGDGVVKHLLNDGHEVTYLTAMKYINGHHPNLREIDISGISAAIPHNKLNMTFMIQTKNYFNNHIVMSYVTLPYSRLVFENDNVQALLNDTSEEFDAVIAEWTYNELIAGFATVFNCPLIWLSPIEVDWMVLNLIDEPSNPAYSAPITSYNEIPFTFIQRVQELWTRISVKFRKYIQVYPEERKLYNMLIAPYIKKRGRQPPSYYDVQYNGSLVLANSHVSTGNAIALPQNYIPIGGYYIDENIPPLPESLQKIFDDAVHGVIFFSMGSNMPGTGMPDTMRRSLLKMFGTLKQAVIWKFEDNMTDVPKNVHILQFAPQFSILNEPKLKLFISHGGLLSTTEAVHFGVPMIGIPTFLDQFYNINKVVKKGFGKSVDLTSPNIASELNSAIEEILNNPRYREKAKEISFIYHDRPVKPGAELVHWVKHVVRTRGARHLRSPAAFMPFYQKLYLDLLGFIVIIIIAIVKIFKSLLSKRQMSYSQRKKVD